MASERVCLVCGRKSTLFNTCLKLSEGRWICSDCKLYTGVVVFNRLKHMTDDEIIEAVTTKKGGKARPAAKSGGTSIKDRVTGANGDSSADGAADKAPDAEGIITVKGLLGEVLTVDRAGKKITYQAAPVSRKEIPVAAVYDFKDIISYVLIEDTSSVLKKPICRTLKVKITVQDERERDIYIHILNNDHVYTGSDKYKRSAKTAKQILLLLQMICKGEDASKAAVEQVPVQEESQAGQPLDENVPEMLREYKKLLDDGVITEEEFEAKKAQLLGL